MHEVNFLIIQGAGTAAHLMLNLWPSLALEGWEIDSIVSDTAYVIHHNLTSVSFNMIFSIPF